MNIIIIRCLVSDNRVPLSVSENWATTLVIICRGVSGSRQLFAIIYTVISNQKNTFENIICYIYTPRFNTKVSTVKFLGATIDENLTFNDHVNKVITKISKSEETTLPVDRRRNA